MWNTSSVYMYTKAVVADAVLYGCWCCVVWLQMLCGVVADAVRCGCGCCVVWLLMLCCVVADAVLCGCWCCAVWLLMLCCMVADAVLYGCFAVRLLMLCRVVADAVPCGCGCCVVWLQMLCGVVADAVLYGCWCYAVWLQMLCCVVADAVWCVWMVLQLCVCLDTSCWKKLWKLRHHLHCGTVQQSLRGLRSVSSHAILSYALDSKSLTVIIALTIMTTMVDSTKVLCPLFDETEMLIPGDSPSIFPCLDQMWNFLFIIETKKNNHWSSSWNWSGCIYYTLPKILSPAAVLTLRSSLLF